VHQRATLVELSQLDGCEPKFFGQIRHGSDGVLESGWCKAIRR
jgi:hypothetical protein